jgi:trans-aconitate methyltransferase
MGAAHHGPAWAGEPYAAASAHHRSHDDGFLARHPPDRDAAVIDAGCGSGEFTARLAGIVDRGHVLGVEPDASMLTAARRRGAGIPNLTFSPGRLQDLDVVCGAASADLIVSRAVFHWVPLDEYAACYGAIHRTLRPGGWLHAESGAAGNIRRVTDLIDDACTHLGLSTTAALWQPDPGTAYELLERAGFDVDAGRCAASPSAADSTVSNSSPGSTHRC